MTTLKSSSQASTYYSKDNYYTKEPTAESLEKAEWYGKGAEVLGLVDQDFDPDKFKELLEGKEIKYIDSRLAELAEYMKQNRMKKITVIVSGDPGFYSMLNYLENVFGREELEVIPGISSVQYMFARLGMHWYDAFVSSLHGKEFNFTEKLNDYNKMGLLTDSKFTPQRIAGELFKNKQNDVKIFVGENLSYENEKIWEFFPENPPYFPLFTLRAKARNSPAPSNMRAT